MDPITHAASGAVAMLALPGRPATRWAWPLAAIVCASPDIDLAFIYSPTDFLYLHRGITHSFAAMPVFGFLLALCCWPLWRKSTPHAWKFRWVWLFCCAMILLHIWLDVVTTYGTMVFIPFSHYRVRLNSIYIIDLLVTVPLLWAIWRWRAKRGLILLTLAWTFFYPALGIAINGWHTAQAEARFAEQGRQVTEVKVLPDAFAPFFWRVIFQENTPDGPTVRNMGINALGEPRTPENIYQAAPAALVENLKDHSLEGEAFFNFTFLPVMDRLPAKFLPQDMAENDNSTFVMFYDLRFGSDIEWVRNLLNKRPDADLPFLFMAGLLADPALYGSEAAEADPLSEQDIGLVRLRFSDSGRDSSWHKPLPPRQPEFLAWLVGLP